MKQQISKKIRSLLNFWQNYITKNTIILAFKKKKAVIIKEYSSPFNLHQKEASKEGTLPSAHISCVQIQGNGQKGTFQRMERGHGKSGQGSSSPRAEPGLIKGPPLSWPGLSIMDQCLLCLCIFHSSLLWSGKFAVQMLPLLRCLHGGGCGRGQIACPLAHWLLDHKEPYAGLIVQIRGIELGV